MKRVSKQHEQFTDDQHISFSQCLNREINWLSNKEKETCEYLKDNAQDVIHMTISDLAECCTTSEAAIVRLSQKLGYKGYQAMKIAIAQESIKPTSQIYEELSPDDTILTIVEKVFHSNGQALLETLKVLNVDNVEKAVNLIINSQRLFFYGVGGSNIIALDGQHKFLRIGYLAHVFSDTNLQMMSTVLVKKNDVVLIISHSGASKEIIEMAKIVKSKGAQIISITNYSRCPLLKYSDVPLFTSSPETAFKPEAISSRIAELTIIDSLFIGVSLTKYDSALSVMQATRNVQAPRKV